MEIWYGVAVELYCLFRLWILRPLVNPVYILNDIPDDMLLLQSETTRKRNDHNLIRYIRITKVLYLPRPLLALEGAARTSLVDVSSLLDIRYNIDVENVGT